MGDKPKNPPAFPRTAADPDWGLGTDSFEGMSLRDWFAGQALAGLCANAEFLRNLPAFLRISCRRAEDTDSVTADLAFKYAAAMLTERERGQ